MNYFFIGLLIPSICVLVGLGLGWVCTSSIDYFKNRKKKKMNNAEELEKMYKLRNHFEELQFKNTRMHDNVLKELNSEIRMVEHSIFMDLGKAVYEQKRLK